MPLAALLSPPTDRALAATFVVTKTADTADGACDSDCSLREAMIAANASPGADTISVPAGTYNLTLGAGAGGGKTANLSSAALGDTVSLAVTDDVTINGAGQSGTIVDAGQNFTVLYIPIISGNQISAEVTDMTIRNGLGSAGGGGIYVYSGNTLIVRRVMITGNGGGGSSGGGIRNDGQTQVIDSTIANNWAQRGGGVYNSYGTLEITNSTISANQAVIAGGALDGTGAATLINVIVRERRRWGLQRGLR